MRKISPFNFTGARAWDALPVETFTGTTTIRLHWSDAPYKWHVNDGPEVFVVLDGVVDMRTRQNGQIITHRLQPGDIFHVENGDEHVAHPVGTARILVIEQQGSV